MKTHHALLIGLAVLLLAACSPMGGMGDMAADRPLVEAPDGEISVSEAWVRTPAMAGGNGAAYMIISNRTDSDERLMAASVDFANVVEIHETYAVEAESEGEGMEMGDMMGMRPVEGGLLIEAGQDAHLEPGSYHIMLLEVPEAPAVGSTVTITLTFESGLTIDVQAEVREG